MILFRALKIQTLLVASIIGFFVTPTSQAQVGFQPLWSLGTQNASPEEFGYANGNNDTLAANSAATKDDDYFFAGTYAVVGSVATAEPLLNFENTLSTWDLNDRIHFTLTAAQASANSRLRISTRLLWGGWYNTATSSDGKDFGNHQIRIRVNGQTVETRMIRHDQIMTVTVNASAVNAVAGENVLEFTRLSSTYNGWISYDFVTAEADATALLNADNDGLPRWWEQTYGFNDTLSTDASQDSDLDGLTNLQEFTAGTNPREADTDGDTLKDGAETTSNPKLKDTDGDSLTDAEEIAASSSPTLVDTDGDGAADAWELRTGYTVNSTSSTPPSFPHAIGLHFVSETKPKNALTAYEVTGLVPQASWNNSIILSNWDNAKLTCSTADIASPQVGVLRNSAGAATTATVNWSSEDTYASSNGGSATQNLLNGGLVETTQINSPSVTFGSIPYTTYDVLVYVGSPSDTNEGYVRLNDDSNTDKYFLSWSRPPVNELLEPVSNNSTRPRIGNVVRFRNVTGSSFNVKLTVTSGYDVFIHGIQIVNSTADTDGDGMPDWFEVMHKLKAAVNDASLDPDGDTLINSQELARNTNPHLADTDGDGLTDAVETNTGTYTSTSNTGSNPLVSDTDGDSISDSAEVNRLPVATNPNLADTDGDGRSDAEEQKSHTDPTSSNVATAHMPAITTSGSTRTFTWDVNCQLVWDHSRGHTSELPWGSRGMMWLSLNNKEMHPDGNALAMQLYMVGDKITYFMHTNRDGAFSGTTATDSIWQSDWNDPPVDLKAAMGFSGHGPVDISDRLRLRLRATRSGTANSWSVQMTVFNYDTNLTVVSSPAITGSTAVANIQNNDPLTWTNGSVDNRVYVSVHEGVQFHMLASGTATSIENQPAYANFKDTDEDGMPDTWEQTRGLNMNSAADAALDGDNDGLSNLREYLAGTAINDADSDDDGAKDGTEVDARSNPLLAASKPIYWNGLPTGMGNGEDLNNNGMADGWEWFYAHFDLLSSADSDYDGMTNWAESVAGTDPLSAASKLWSLSERSGAANFMLRWPVLPYKRHQVFYSDGLATWQLATGTPVVSGSEYRQTFTNALTSNPRRFYRASVNDLDADNDGVSDWTEQNVLKSSTTNANSLRSSISIDTNADTTADTTVAGDRVALMEKLQGGQTGGGFAGGASAATGISAAQASRFLIQSTFGTTLEDITRVQQLGYSAWITEQMAKPASLQRNYIKSIYEDFFGARADQSYLANRDDDFIFGNNVTTAFARAAIQGEDQLRQRVAFALSQILVASRRDAALEGQPMGVADYYDIFVRHAFGNYNDILMEVTMHPVMGRYLSHVGNQKANPTLNQYPDENYAREVMQLFSIGLWKLNNDGSRVLNASSQPIPTYSNTEITQLARVLTGFWFSGLPWGNGGYTFTDYSTPMTLDPQRHDFGAKTLLNGYVIPAREPSEEAAMQDVRDAIRHLFNHENTPPFICKQLIQFLATDNPSPAYVTRVVNKFINNGSGVRGDLGAVVRAILLDAEAREPQYTLSNTLYGRLKEPVIRTMALGRAFGLKNQPNLIWWDWHDFYEAARQEPSYSPSVFNFYRPEYKAPGLLTNLQRFGPVFQITDSYSAIAFPNKLWDIIERGFSYYEQYSYPFDLSREVALASQPEKLADHLNLLFCAGQMSMTNRNTMIAAINAIPAARAEARARMAVYLALVTPEGAVMR